jgi:hypothetical protein
MQCDKPFDGWMPGHNCPASSFPIERLLTQPLGGPLVFGDIHRCMNHSQRSALIGSSAVARRAGQ